MKIFNDDTTFNEAVSFIERFYEQGLEEAVINKEAHIYSFLPSFRNLLASDKGTQQKALEIFKSIATFHEEEWPKLLPDRTIPSLLSAIILLDQHKDIVTNLSNENIALLSYVVCYDEKEQFESKAKVMGYHNALLNKVGKKYKGKEPYEVYDVCTRLHSLYEQGERKDLFIKKACAMLDTLEPNFENGTLQNLPTYLRHMEYYYGDSYVMSLPDEVKEELLTLSEDEAQLVISSLKTLKNYADKQSQFEEITQEIHNSYKSDESVTDDPLKAIFALAVIMAKYHSKINGITNENIAFIAQYCSVMHFDECLAEYATILGSNELLDLVKEKATTTADRFDAIELIENQFYDEDLDSEYSTREQIEAFHARECSFVRNTSFDEAMRLIAEDRARKESLTAAEGTYLQ